jgi:hypothetical protein
VEEPEEEEEVTINVDTTKSTSYGMIPSPQNYTDKT